MIKRSKTSTIYFAILFTYISPAVSLGMLFKNQKVSAWNHIVRPFSYQHPDRWFTHYSKCAGESQSPVNIIHEELEYTFAESHLTFNAYRHKPNSMYIINNGRTLQVSGIWKDVTPFLSGGPLKGNYTFEQLHFHWSQDDLYGSEHIVNNQSFAMEMHVVHYKQDYTDFDEAALHEDGLVITAYLFGVTPKDVTHGVTKLKPYIKHMRSPANKQIRIQPFALSLFDLEFRVDYVMYSGSLTTPPCAESVTWLVCTVPLYITYDEVNTLHTFKLKNLSDTLEDRQTIDKN